MQAKDAAPRPGDSVKLAPPNQPDDAQQLNAFAQNDAKHATGRAIVSNAPPAQNQRRTSRDELYEHDRSESFLR